MNTQSPKKPVNWYSIIAFCLILFCAGWIIGVYFSVIETEAHNLGDAMGGLTAPIIGFVSSVLIYLSFQAQIKANEKIQEQIDKSHEQVNFEFLQQEIQRVQDLFEEFQEVRPRNSTLSAGITSLKLGLESRNPQTTNIHGPTDESLKRQSKELFNIFSELINLTTTIKDIQASENHKGICRRKVWHYYQYYIQNEIEEFRKLKMSDEYFDEVVNVCQISSVAERYLEEYKEDYENTVHRHARS